MYGGIFSALHFSAWGAVCTPGWSQR
ncbi:hypothetical protein ACQWHR_27210, partial [Salmonella enterica subsp. enterica serovar Infantis]